MPTQYCLTIDVKSKAIEDGLGYMVAFTLQDDGLKPADVRDYANWQEDVKNAVLRTGDQVFASDPYTRKLAIAHLMNELAALNGAYGLHIGGDKNIPAVQVQSSNPFDPRIDIDFTDEDGHFAVREHSPPPHGSAPAPAGQITAHGHVSLTAPTRDFPFAPKPVPPAAGGGKPKTFRPRR
jgi:hypothetical protein